MRILILSALLAAVALLSGCDAVGAAVMQATGTALVSL